jgi:hypothetical protein
MVAAATASSHHFKARSLPTQVGVRGHQLLIPRVNRLAFARREEDVDVGGAEPQYTVVFPRGSAFELSLARHLDTKTTRIRR